MSLYSIFGTFDPSSHGVFPYWVHLHIACYVDMPTRSYNTWKLGTSLSSLKVFLCGLGMKAWAWEFHTRFEEVGFSSVFSMVGTLALTTLRLPTVAPILHDTVETWPCNMCWKWGLWSCCIFRKEHLPLYPAADAENGPTWRPWLLEAPNELWRHSELTYAISSSSNWGPLNCYMPGYVSMALGAWLLLPPRIDQIRAIPRSYNWDIQPALSRVRLLSRCNDHRLLRLTWPLWLLSLAAHPCRH